MDGMVRTLAPRSLLQMAGLFLLAQVLIGAAAFAYDVGVHEVPAGTYLGNMFGTFVVASPFVFLVLLMLRHQLVLLDRLVELAATDALTGLLNRRAFLGGLARDGKALEDGVLMVVDVDRFKEINDAYGHDAGDRCIDALAGHLRRHVGASGQICRLGGDEFVIFLTRADLGTARRIGEAIAAGIEMTFRETHCRITLAVGAVKVERGGGLAEAMRNADDHMYQAKQSGLGKMSAPIGPWSLTDLPTAAAPIAM